MSDNTNNKSSVAKDRIPLVSPLRLAYRLCYLYHQQQTSGKENHQEGALLRITRKGLENLAIDTYTVSIDTQQPVTSTPKVSITEAYIACVTYELERINCCLVKVDREYLIGAQATIRKLKRLASDDDKAKALFGLPWDSLQQSVHTLLSNVQPIGSTNKKKVIEEGDEQQVLLCIWQELLKQAKASIDISTIKDTPISSNKITPLTYKGLCDRLSFQLHQNGLASYLYSIEQYCQTKQLPRLDYLVVKEGTGFAEGILATDIEAIKVFHAQLEEIVSSVKTSDSRFQAKPEDLNFVHKPRAKRTSKKQVIYTPLVGR